MTDWRHDLQSPRAARRCGSVAGGTTDRCTVAGARASADQSVIELSRLVRGLTTTARVLVVGMHPDDEDTQLITWLSRAQATSRRHTYRSRAAKPGANLGGSESGNSLGAIRTEEVLAARRIDGAHAVLHASVRLRERAQRRRCIQAMESRFDRRRHRGGDSLVSAAGDRRDACPIRRSTATVSIRRWSCSSLRRTSRRRALSLSRRSVRNSVARVANLSARARLLDRDGGLRSRVGKDVRRTGGRVARAAAIAGTARSRTAKADANRTAATRA